MQEKSIKSKINLRISVVNGEWYMKKRPTSGRFL